jgi:hypothetical protein
MTYDPETSVRTKAEKRAIELAALEAYLREHVVLREPSEATAMRPRKPRTCTVVDEPVG